MPPEASARSPPEASPRSAPSAGKSLFPRGRRSSAGESVGDELRRTFRKAAHVAMVARRNGERRVSFAEGVG